VIDNRAGSTAGGNAQANPAAGGIIVKRIVLAAIRRFLVSVTEKPSSGLSPALLAIVGLLVVAAIAVGIIVIKKPGKETETADSKPRAENRGKAPRSASPSSYAERTPGSSKAAANREGTRPDPGLTGRRGGEELDEMFVRISVEARDELKDLRAKYATAYDDPEERRQFGIRLSQITDPQERQRVLLERTETMRRARAEADAAKSAEDLEREKELIALMQVQNLWRMAEFVGKNSELAPEVEEFDERLAQWIEDSESMDSATFHSTFNTLRDPLNELRQRNAKTTHSNAGPADLPSRRPERNP
jgi:hypothetical protein